MTRGRFRKGESGGMVLTTRILQAGGIACPAAGSDIPISFKVRHFYFASKDMIVRLRLKNDGWEEDGVFR